MKDTKLKLLPGAPNANLVSFGFNFWCPLSTTNEAGCNSQGTTARTDTLWRSRVPT